MTQSSSPEAIISLSVFSGALVSLTPLGSVNSTFSMRPFSLVRTNEKGRIEKVELTLPKGVKLTSAPEKTLSDMIASGELDCVIIARPPDSFRNNHPDVVRLFPDFEAMEQDYYEKT